MTEFLQTTVDKFTFRVATDRRYSNGGLWIRPEEGGRLVRLGLSDFLQQNSGDVAFAEVKPAGTVLAAGDQVASIETIKVVLDLPSPIGGRITEVNPAMDVTPELINQDPYGEGWLAKIEAGDWETVRSGLLEPEAYFALMRSQAEEEAKKL